jgi:Fuc2NAc and GlcNAc transferase
MSLLLAAALTSYLLLLRLIPFLHSQLLDQPNARSSHQQPTPRGGGVSFVIIASASSCIALISGPVSAIDLCPLIALPLAVIGLIDDRYDLPSAWRYIAQSLTSAVIIVLSPLIHDLGFPSPSSRLILLPVIALLVIGVTAVINFTNFMDGLDGLVAGCMAVAITAATIRLGAPSPIWALVGALLGFLVWNWSPAKVFMGDVGSTFLGAVFALLVLQSLSWPDAFALLLVATPLIGDAFLCVLRRLIAGHRVYEAHCLHLYQRLHQAGWPHALVSCLYIMATVILAFAFLLGGLAWVLSFAVIELLIGLWLDQRVAVPFAVASRN